MTNVCNSAMANSLAVKNLFKGTKQQFLNLHSFTPTVFTKPQLQSDTLMMYNKMETLQQIQNLMVNYRVQI